MLRISDIDEIVAISHSLANKKRLKIISLLNTGTSMSLREIYDATRDQIHIEHRETLYKYIESLVEVKLLSKMETERGVVYRSNFQEIIFDLAKIC